MKILGISPLDLDASASLVEDGKILFASGEERYSRKKQHAGFPRRAIEAALKATNTDPSEIDQVAYAFFPWDHEARLVEEAIQASRKFWAEIPEKKANLDALRAKVKPRTEAIPGLKEPNQMVDASTIRKTYRTLAGSARFFASAVSRRAEDEYLEETRTNHKHWQEELEAGLKSFGLENKLKRYEHHTSHAANAYLVSGYDRALIVTLDGYGSGLSGSVSLGENGKIERLKNITFPNSLGSFYESVTGALGFRPDRHAGKIVGLAAYGDPELLSCTLLDRFEIDHEGGFAIRDNLNVYFSRHLSANFPMIDVAAAYQKVLEKVVQGLVGYWVQNTNCDTVVLSGGVTANVKMNQRVFETEGVQKFLSIPIWATAVAVAESLYTRLPRNFGARPSRPPTWDPNFRMRRCRKLCEQKT